MQAQTTLTEHPAPRRSLVGPAILIGIPVVWLLKSTGGLDWTHWDTLLRLWPALLIVSGLNLLAGRPSRTLSALITFVLVVGIGAALLRDEARERAGAQVTTELVSQPVEGARHADIELVVGGQLHLDASTHAATLIEGTVERRSRDRLSRDLRVDADTIRYALHGPDSTRFRGPFATDPDEPLVWDLRLSPTVQMALDVQTGRGDATLDLSALHVTDLRLDIGLGTTELILPAYGRVEAEVAGGVGTTSIVIPAGMAARIHATTGLGRVSVHGTYERDDELYVSPDYDTSDHRVDLRVSGGIGNITIRQAGDK